MNNQTPAMFFKTLGMDKDGFLSRTDLNDSAKRLGWSWHEAPLLAVFDLLSISKPIPKSEFIALIHQIYNDPLGPYGNILLKSPLFFQYGLLRANRIPNDKMAGEDNPNQFLKEGDPGHSDFESLTELLGHAAGSKAALKYQSLLEALEIAHIPADDAALIIIDPQRSFTEGALMHSIGYGGEMDVIPIRSAFDNCSALLNRFYGQMEVMFTRCPFPADSYGWAGRLADHIDRDQLYFIKPGNSVLVPHTNGIR